MRFLLKAAFWLAVVAVLLPSNDKPLTVPKPQLSATEAVSAAAAAMSDMRQFCSRQPDACEVGSQAAVTLGHRAQAGAKKQPPRESVGLLQRRHCPGHGASERYKLGIEPCPLRIKYTASFSRLP